MAGSALTIFELEADGFTHLSYFCEGCRRTRQITFQHLLHRAGFMVAPLTLEELRLKLRCDRCADRPNPSSVQPWRQSDISGYIKHDRFGNHPRALRR